MKRALALAVLFAAACSTPPRVAERPAPEASPQSKGGYYKDDGPGSAPPPNLAQIADAEPKPEALHRYANRPYKVFGTEYVPIADAAGFKQRGVASWYGRRFHGQKTASGELYDMYAMTAAHPTLPSSYVRVTNVANGRGVVVRVNDRGPFHSSRVIDLSPRPQARLHRAARRWSSASTRARAGQAVYVQVGAFSARSANRCRRVTRELVAAESAQVLLSGNLWRLHVGPYRSRDDARSVADRIAGELDLKPLVVVR
jgi:rare lipoprotein A